MNDRQIQRICDWNTAVGNYKGCWVDAELEWTLLREEVEETVQAIKDKNPVEVIDGVMDIIFVAIGTLHKMGVHQYDIIEAMDWVIESNFTKFPFTKREDGKICKSDRFVAPDLRWEVPKDSFFKVNWEIEKVETECREFKLPLTDL